MLFAKTSFVDKKTTGEGEKYLEKQRPWRMPWTSSDPMKNIVYEEFYEEKRSRFIGEVLRVQNEVDVQDYLQVVRKKYYESRHQPFAYILGDRGEQQKASDDGEPSGTAGMPILEILKRAGMTYTLVVVTRYFGGIKLGAGPLARAYAHTAQLVLRGSKIVERLPMTRMRLSLAYPLWGAVENFLRSQQIQVENISYTTQVTATILLPTETADTSLQALTNLTAAKMTCEDLGATWMEVPVPNDDRQ